MTATASATLIAPRAEGRLSGGFLVNLSWLENDFLHAEEATTAAELERILSSSGDRLMLVDSLYLYDTETATLLTRAARARPIVLLAHSLPSLIPGPAVGKRLEMLDSERAFLCEACGAIAPSRFMAGALARRGLAPKTVHIVRPAPVVDARVARPESSTNLSRTGPPRILTVANWTPAKGIDHAVRALATITTDWRWTVVGSTLSHPAYSQRVRDLIDEAGLTDRVEIVPPKPPAELSGYYATSDLFLLPSLMESYGLVFSEAITFGVPVVGYRCAAVREVVSGPGQLVDAGDVCGLAAAIRAELGRFDRSDRPDAPAPVALPTRSSSRSELETAIRALSRITTRREGER